MGMPRKGSRRITVEDKDFLWRFKGRRRYYGNAFSSGTLTVQEDVPRPGRVMQIHLVAKHWDPDQGEFTSNKSTLSPSDVEIAIRAALENGWNPSERGAAWGECDPLDLEDYKTEERAGISVGRASD